VEAITRADQSNAVAPFAAAAINNQFLISIFERVKSTTPRPSVADLSVNLMGAGLGFLYRYTYII
jgi:hypothetical protein